MMNAYHRSLYAAVAVALVLAVGLAAAAEPQVSFTHVPAYGSTENLVGRVENVDCATHAVAVYIFVDTWWTKPNFAAPLSPIAPDGAWTCDITTGGSDIYAMQLAAYVVPIDYAPPLAAGWAQLPDELAENAVASVRATRPYTRRIWFSGYEWSVKDSHGQTTGPGDNVFSDSASNVWVDEQGRLHLKICRRDGVWSCAEVVSVRSFGHGTYRIFADTAADALDARAVLGLFTWNDDAPYAHREIDIELSRWDNASDANNAQYVVQPWDQPGRLTRYRVPPDVTNATYSFSWRTDRIDFATCAGHVIPPPSAGGEIAAWSFAGDGLPQPGGENYRINLWLCNTSGTTDGEDEEVIISRFAFLGSSARKAVGIVETHDRPLPGDPPAGWRFNRMDASRGLLKVYTDAGGDQEGTVSYSQPQAGMLRAKVVRKLAEESWTFGGEVHYLGRDVTIGAIYPPVIKAEFQPRLSGMAVDVISAASPSGLADLVFTLQFEHEMGQSSPPVVSQSWSRSELLDGAFPKTFQVDIAPEFNDRIVNKLVWKLDKASVGDTVDIGEIRLIYDMPELETAEEAMVIWLGQLLRCYNGEAKIVEDKINSEPGKRENITATGKLCKLLALAAVKGLVHADVSRELVAGMAGTILHGLPKGPANLLPHFTSGGGKKNNGEWSSGDTAYTLLDLIVALRMLDLESELAKAVAHVKSIDWAALKAPNGGFYHGYEENNELIGHTWFGFGTEMIGVLLAAHIGGVPGLMGPPPSDNGSGFIDEAGYPITPIGKDRFGNSWFAARTAAGQKQVEWYADPAHACGFYADNGLFGLSACEKPSGWDADEKKIYQAYGVGGTRDVPLYQENGHFVVAGHYHAMIADLRPADAVRMHKALISRRLLSPLNMLESLSVNAAGEIVHVNALQGSWNLALGAEGWLFTDSALVRAAYQAMLAVPELAAAWRHYFPDKGDPDFDSDGLADQVEDEMGTRWDHPDTDGDGLFDADDPAPTVFNDPGTFPVLTIEPDTVRVEAGTAAPDLMQGVSAVDGNDGDLTDQVQIEGTVNVQALGEYIVWYEVVNQAGLKSSGARTYRVSDTTPPLLLIEPDFVLCLQGAGLNLREGVQATDSFEGDLTPQVVLTGEVDSDTPGEYQIVYNAADSSGNAASPRSRRYLVSADSDDDNLPDTWELEHFGTLRWNGTDDPDADGKDNQTELAAGTDPSAYAISLRAGWNLVSFSKLPPGADFASVFKPDSLPVLDLAWRWAPERSAYVRCQTLSSFEGIWVFALADVEIIVRP